MLLFLVNLCFFSSVTEPSSGNEFKQILEDDITETGYYASGEMSSSGSTKEISNFDDNLKIGAWKGKEKVITKLNKWKNRQKKSSASTVSIKYYLKLTVSLNAGILSTINKV